MKKWFFVLILAVLSVSLVGCNSGARNWGDTTTIDLPAGKKLMNAGWDKDDNLWYLTRNMTPTDKVETYDFKESSNWGVLSGTVILQEHK